MNEQQEMISQTMEMTAGEMLKNARTTGRRKREISTIAKLLCIREEFLVALEEGNYHLIPETVYILGFARSYAVELGLEPDDVINKLKKELGLIKEEDEDEEDVIVDSEKHTIKLNKEVLLKWFKASVEYVKKHWIWFASGVVALLAVIVLSLMFFGGNTDGNIPETAGISENVETIASKEPDFRYPVREKFDNTKKKDWANARVVLQAEKESWIQIKDSKGSTVFSRVLIPGDVYYLPSMDKMTANFGNVAAFDVWVDGQLIKKLGTANTRKSGVSLEPEALKAVGFAD